MSFCIKNIDCNEYIKERKLNNESEIFDAVITDPPYNISRENNFGTIGRAGINFGNWDYGFDQSTWIINIVPLIKKGGSIIIFNDYKNFGSICQTLEKCGFKTKDLIRWIKNNPMPRNTTRRYVTDYEFAIWATKPGKKWTFNKIKNLSYLRPEFKFPVVTSGSEKIHPTQKSLPLIEEIVKIHTNQDDLIYDPFMGSGTTGVACLKNKRNFIGTEIDLNYYEKAEKRLNMFNTINIKNKNVIRSPIYYLGDKYKLLPEIINFFPKEIDTFYDIFGGGGTMLANIYAKKYVYNDKSENVKNIVNLLWRESHNKIINEVKKNIELFSLKNGSKENKELNKKNFNAAKEQLNLIDNKKSFKYVTLLLTLIFFSFNSQLRFNSKNKFNVPIGKQNFTFEREKCLKNFCIAIKNKKITFASKDFESIILQNVSKNDFFYFDPPYLVSNATYNSDWSFASEKRLLNFLDTLNERGYKWALSNLIYSKGKYNCELKKWSKKYYVHNLNYSYKNSNYQRKNVSNDREVLITNYEI